MLTLFLSAYKSINDCFNIRGIVVFIRSREGYNWAFALGTPRAIAQLQPSLERIQTTISLKAVINTIILLVNRKTTNYQIGYVE